jgi:hypothetical protein
MPLRHDYEYYAFLGRLVQRALTQKVCRDRRTFEEAEHWLCDKMQEEHAHYRTTQHRPDPTESFGRGDNPLDGGRAAIGQARESRRRSNVKTPSITVTVGPVEVNITDEDGNVSYNAPVTINGILHHLTLFPVRDTTEEEDKEAGSYDTQRSLIADYASTLDQLLNLEGVSAFQPMYVHGQDYICYIAPAER